LELSQDKKTLIGCNPTAKRIKIPYGVEIIEEGAFAYCLHLETVKIPNTVKLIKKRVFVFSKIKRIHIPESVIQIDQNAFLQSTFLNEIIVDQKNSIYGSQDGVLYDKKKEILITFPRMKTGDPFIMLDNLKSINNGAFPKFAFVFSVVINMHLEKIDEIGLLYCLN